MIIHPTDAGHGFVSNAPLTKRYRGCCRLFGTTVDIIQQGNDNLRMAAVMTQFMKRSIASVQRRSKEENEKNVCDVRVPSCDPKFHPFLHCISIEVH